jgi:flavin reductase (DIM6/NTAB) family NADH-FMN oxidoreductase RutF
MFYEPDKDDHGLPFNPYKSIVVPRPIGWISTISRDGIVNLAPYSQFNNLGYDPPYVMFSGNCFPGTGRRKDGIKNATDTGEFVVNVTTYDLRKAINVTSQFLSPKTDEAALAGLDMIPSPDRQSAARRGIASASGVRFHCSLALPGNAPDQVHWSSAASWAYTFAMTLSPPTARSTC